VYHLKVSYNAGWSYSEKSRAEGVKEFEEETAKLDKKGLRWVIEDDAGNIRTDLVCKVFNEILGLDKEN